MEENMETVDIFAESATLDNEIAGPSARNRADNEALTPLTAAISPNFEFRTDQIDLDRLQMNDRTPTRPVNSEQQRTPGSGGPRRNLFAVSPVKQTSRKRANEETIKTLVFMDFETSGLFAAGEPKRNYNLKKSRCPADFASELEKFLLETQKDNYPRVLELSFVAVPRETFERYGRQMEQLKNHPEASSIRIRVPCNIHTRQINPSLTEAEWEQYDRKKSQFPGVLLFERTDLSLKNPFNVEWKQLTEFLETCPKPACLVAHNGLYFDFRLLYGELTRYSLLESHPLPKGMYFLDSLIALQHIEDSLKQRMSQTLRGINWNSNDFDEDPAIPADHPLNFLNRSEWPTALFRRFLHTDFKKSASGQWEFSPSGKKYNLKGVYETTVGGSGDFHYAQEDSEALLQICLSYGAEFLYYMDSTAAEVPF